MANLQGPQDMLRTPTTQLHLDKILDPRLDLQATDERDYVVLKGAGLVSWNQFPVPAISNSGYTVSCNPPNRDVGVSRLVLQNHTYIVTITGTNSTSPLANLLQPGFFAPRAYPIQSTLQNSQMAIGTTLIANNPIYQFQPALMWYHNRHKMRFGRESLTPSYLDQSQQYADNQNSARNPLSVYNDQAFEQARGGFSGMTILTNTPTSATLQITCTEPLMFLPFVGSENADFVPVLIGIDTMQYTCSFVQNLNRIMSLTVDQGTASLSPASIAITNVSVVLQSAQMLFEYLTPDVVQNIPRNLVSAYYYPDLYQQASTQLIAPGQSVVLKSGNIQLSGVPKRLYIWSSKDANAKTPFDADSYFGLPQNVNPLQIMWNSNNYFNFATPYDLYAMSFKNGLDMSWDQYNKYCGAIICVEFGSDVGLPATQAPGVLLNAQLSVTCQFQNLNSVSIAPTIYTLIVYEGLFSMIDGVTQAYLNILNSSQVLNSKLNRQIKFKQSENYYGGNFFSSIKNAFSKVGNYIKDNKLVSRIASLIPHPYAKAIQHGAEKIGLGVSGGRRHKKAGAKKMSHAQLKRRLMGGDLFDEEDDEGQEECSQAFEINEFVLNELDKLNLSPEEYSEVYEQIIDKVMPNI